MLPERVALAVADLTAQQLPQVRRLPHTAGPELQTDEAGEDLLGGAALNPAATHHLPQRYRMRQMRSGGLRSDDLDPALHERQQRLQLLQRLDLGRRLLRGEHARLQRRADRLGIGGVDLRDGLLNGAGIDPDLTGIGLDSAQQLAAQPRDVGVQTRGGGLTHCQEHADLLGIGLQALSEGRDIGGHERGTGLSLQRQPDVGGGHGLARELADGMADLEAEGGARHRPHDLGQGADLASGVPLLGIGGGQVLRLTLQGSGESSGSGLGDRGAHVLPHRQRLLDPLRAGPRLARPGRRHEIGGGVQPQVGHPQRLAGRIGLGGSDRRIAALAGLLEGEGAPHGPVDRTILRTGHHLLHLGAHRHHLPGTDLRHVHPAHLGELSGIDAGGAQSGNGVPGDLGAEEGGKHLLDVVEGVLAHVIPPGGASVMPCG